MLALPEGMWLGYLNELVKKKPDIPDLYQLFLEFYRGADFGFQELEPAILSRILSSKTPSDTQKTADQIKDLPEIIPVYRGGSNIVSTPADKAYSWTLDKNIANFFACRLGSDDGYLAEGEIKKSDILEASLDVDEQEILIDPKNVLLKRETPIKGKTYLDDILPKVQPDYLKALSEICLLYQEREDGDHGRSHTVRVVLLSLILAHEIKLTNKDKETLLTAAIYHDVGRVNDRADKNHGKLSRLVYEQSNDEIDPVADILIEAHSLPDIEGLWMIWSSGLTQTDKRRAESLYKILKDADALDRVRFGLKGLDLSYLRLGVSQTLGLCARLILENIRLPKV